MTPEQKDKLHANLAALPKMASAWLMTLAGALGTFWLSLKESQQLEIIAASPLPIWSYPIVLTLIGYVLRVWPQRIYPPPAAAAQNPPPPKPGRQP